jgi:hypothetical protein
VEVGDDSGALVASAIALDGTNASETVLDGDAFAQLGATGAGAAAAAQLDARGSIAR